MAEEAVFTGSKFWMVWSPQGGTPGKKHATLDDARTEANRLATSNPTREFFLLEAKESYRTSLPPVETRMLA